MSEAKFTGTSAAIRIGGLELRAASWSLSFDAAAAEPLLSAEAFDHVTGEMVFHAAEAAWDGGENGKSAARSRRGRRG